MLESIITFWSQILYALINIRFFDLIDIAAIAFIIYQITKFLKDSRAGLLVKGIVIILIVSLMANWFNLVTMKWILTRIADSIIIVAAIVFQPELRRALEKMGRSNISNIGKFQGVNVDYDNTVNCINSVCKAANDMQEKKIGALMVFERKTPLGDIANTGTEIDAAVSTELLENIFYPKSPLHDGGMVIRNNRVLSAGCILPLTANTDINSQLGTRHRAAIGMSESSDAVVVVVSEETGVISIACNGKLTRGYNPISLREDLNNYLLEDNNREASSITEWLKKLFAKKEKSGSAAVTAETEKTEEGEK